MPAASPALLAHHAAAGARYAAAVAEVHASLIELAAAERLMPSAPEQSFEAWQPDAIADLRHRQFVPSPPHSIRAAVDARRITLAAELDGETV